MTAYNIVRFKVKQGQEAAFLDSQRGIARNAMPGFRKGAIIKHGDRAYTFVAEWDSFDDIVRARPQMIASLDGFRNLLEDLGGGLGVTDPISGSVVLEIG